MVERLPFETTTPNCLSRCTDKGKSETAASKTPRGSEMTEMSGIPTFPHCSPYSGVVNKVVLGLGDDLDVVKRCGGSGTWAHLHTQPPLPHGSFL